MSSSLNLSDLELTHDLEMTPEEWNTSMKKGLEFVKPCLGKYCCFTPSHSIPPLTLQNRLTGQYAFD
jgi:hypothetical protein